ncbi:MAG: NAD(P)H-dependent oxidoreductase [Planctomycetes bacterium]|nr:NAD(P)H-dependent oxidoreductase [Planctomycetota bacterium]
MPTIRVLGFSGSLRTDSYNSRLVRVALEGAKNAGAETTYLSLRDYPLPVFDEDVEAKEGLPANVRRLKEVFHAHHALLISCPEYNSSITAALKNVLDWVSRPAPGEKPLQGFAGKVCSLMAASPGALGGLRGLVTVRSILGNIGVIVLPEQVAVSKAHEAFNADGRLINEQQQAAILRLGENTAGTAMKLHA